MDAGMFRETILIQKKQVLEDELGQQTEVWTDYYPCHAYVNGLSGSEYWAAAQQNAENTVVFTVRYSAKVEHINPTEYRVLFKKRIYDIQSVDNVQFRNDIVKIRGTERLLDRVTE